MARRTVHPWLLFASAGVLACSTAKDPSGGTDLGRPDHSSADSPRDTPSGGHLDAGGNGPTPPGPIVSDEPIVGLPTRDDDPTDGGTPACASAATTGELQQLALAFAFDVSGSMGQGDEPYHDRQLKWEPIVQASKAFFGSTEVARVSASLVFFPAEDAKCEVASYEQPDVELTTLPAAAFGDAIDAVTPESEDDWRGGTPTLAVVRATIDYVQSLRDAGSTARHAIVLVTDGTPAGCAADDRIDGVAELVASVSDEIPIYVIGVANPVTEEEPDPPDNVSNLHQIAVSGGTESAYLVDTGNPEQTVNAFNQAIARIRSQGLSCEVEIPPPPSGKTFDKEAINVSLTTGGIKTELGYSVDCSDTDAWRFDDPETPTQIVLCDDACGLTKSAADAALQVEFGCERRSADVR